MKKLIWTLQIILALAMGGAGAMKLATAPSDLRANPAMAWAQDFSDTQVKLIGAAELAGAVGLIVPAATGIAVFLTPLAAALLGVLMGGAVWTHIRRDEPFIVPLVITALLFVTAYLRFANPPARKS
jgi:hypothetical protein